MFGTLTRAVGRLEKSAFASLQHRFSSGQRFVHLQTKSSRTGYLLLLCPLTAFGLGCWQVKRRRWKLALIDELQARTSAPPQTELSEDLRKLDDMEYSTVRIRGVFDHDREVYVGPRADLTSKQTGFFVVTPLRLEDRDYSILVNRGWVPRAKVNPATRREGQTSGVVEIDGVIRKTEPKPIGSGSIRSGAYFAMRDVELISKRLGTAPVFVNAMANSSVPGGPVGGQTRVELRNEHLTYSFTWFSLSAATLFMWYQQYGKRLHARR